MFQSLKEKYWRNRPMVSYWKTSDSVEAKVYRTKEGHYSIQMKGEQHAFVGHPRGTVLYDRLSKLKHQIKNKIFNETWKMLEEEKPEPEIREYLVKAWQEIYQFAESMKYDYVPYEHMVPPVKELYRAMAASGCDARLRDVICHIFQEDDAYRFRFQWISKFFSWFHPPTMERFTYALSMLEEAEIVGDMKERERLFKRIFLFMAKDTPAFKKFLTAMNWRKSALNKADKYFFRAKYFKCDYPEYQY